MKSKTVLVLSTTSALAVMAVVMVVRNERGGGRAKHDEDVARQQVLSTLFPGLLARVDDVASVVVEAATVESTVERQSGQWVLLERGGFPVDAGRVRALILSLATMKDLTAKTSRPEMYKSLDVDDASMIDTMAGMEKTKESRAVVVTFFDADRQSLASLIVGRAKYEPGGVPGVYVRKPGEQTSYYGVVDGRGLELPRAPLQWLDVQFADVKRERVRSITISPATGGESERVVVVQDKQGVGEFAVQQIPAGREFTNASIISTLVTGLQQASFEDVKPFAEVSGATPGVGVEVRTWDGLMIRISAMDLAGTTWWRLVAAPDPEPLPAEGSEPATSKRTPEAIQDEVSQFNKKWEAWAFAPYSYKATPFNTSMSLMTKDSAVPAGSPDGSAAPLLIPLQPPTKAPTGG